MKRYDRSYFDRWYRGGEALVTAAMIRRKTRLALAAAEYVLDRELRSVLDVGCGEGCWRAELKRIRPCMSYTGVDSSQYVVRRFGASRDIRAGTVGTVGRLGLPGPFDLIVCSDVIHYVPTPELRRGLTAMRRLASGILYADALTSADAFDGDHEQWRPRAARTYRRLFADAGLVSCGLNCWVRRGRVRTLASLDLCS